MPSLFSSTAATPHCLSPRGSACVQEASAEKIQARQKTPLILISVHIITIQTLTHYSANTSLTQNDTVPATRLRYLSNSLLCAKKRAAAFPATLDRLQVWVAVISEEVLREMLRHAEDQSAVIPLYRGQRSQRHMLRCI